MSSSLLPLSRLLTPSLAVCCDTECGQSFSNSQQLELHYKEHKGEKIQKCDWPSCNRLFSSKEKLRNHIRCRHTGERPYKCPDCDKAFTSPKHLKDHRLLHTGSLPRSLLPPREVPDHSSSSPSAAAQTSDRSVASGKDAASSSVGGTTWSLTVACTRRSGLTTASSLGARCASPSLIMSSATTRRTSSTDPLDPVMRPASSPPFLSRLSAQRLRLPPLLQLLPSQPLLRQPFHRRPLRPAVRCPRPSWGDTLSLPSDSRDSRSLSLSLSLSTTQLFKVASHLLFLPFPPCVSRLRLLTLFARPTALVTEGRRGKRKENQIRVINE